jgi:CBS domain-containing protein
MSADLILGLVLGSLAGVLAGMVVVKLARRGRPVGVATRRDVLEAYLMGYRDCEAGAALDTTRPAELYP